MGEQQQVPINSQPTQDQDNSSDDGDDDDDDMGDEDDGEETAHTGATDGRARKKEEIHTWK